MLLEISLWNSMFWRHLSPHDISKDIYLKYIFMVIYIGQRCVAKRLANDWRHSWCTYDVIDGIHMTSLPVFSQTFGYPSLPECVQVILS